jgi:DNA (cytosine-5)-methyltransferase 1
MADSTSAQQQRDRERARSMVEKREAIRQEDWKASTVDHRPDRKGAWSRFDAIPCADGKARRVESGTFPLAHGVPARVGKLRAYGNAIVPEAAATFVEAVLEVLSPR